MEFRSGRSRYSKEKTVNFSENMIQLKVEPHRDWNEAIDMALLLDVENR